MQGGISEENGFLSALFILFYFCDKAILLRQGIVLQMILLELHVKTMVWGARATHSSKHLAIRNDSGVQK